MIAIVLYIGGFVLGLLFSDGSIGTRVLLAALWPIGPLAFVCTVTGLTIAAMIAFPVFGAIVLAVVAAGWWVLR